MKNFTKKIIKLFKLKLCKVFRGEVHLWQIDENSPYPNKSSSAEYILKGHTDLVRTVSYNESTDVLLTGGDDGCVCLWKLHPDRKSLHRNST